MNKVFGITLAAIIASSAYGLTDGEKSVLEERKIDAGKSMEARRIQAHKNLEARKTSRYWKKDLDDVAKDSETYQRWHLEMRGTPEGYEIRQSTETGRIVGSILLKGKESYLDCKIDCQDFESNDKYSRGDFFSFLTRIHYTTKEKKEPIIVKGKYLGKDLIVHEIEILKENFRLK